MVHIKRLNEMVNESQTIIPSKVDAEIKKAQQQILNANNVIKEYIKNKIIENNGMIVFEDYGKEVEIQHCFDSCEPMTYKVPRLSIVDDNIICVFVDNFVKEEINVDIDELSFDNIVSLYEELKSL